MMKFIRMICGALFISFICAAIFIRCDNLEERLGFDRPEVVSVSPARFAEGVPADTAVRIVFSRDMDTAKTNQAFRLNSESGGCRGSFRWPNGRTLVFFPEGPLYDNMYTITLAETAEDRKGNDLREGIESVFYVNSDLTPPRVLSHTPERNATGVHPAPETDPILYAGSFIRVIFSEAMDMDSIYAGFTISPPVQGLFCWNDIRTEVVFTPIYNLHYGTTYTITLGTSIRDINGNKLREQFSWGFTVGDDFTGPSITSVYQPQSGAAPTPWEEDTDNPGCEKNGDIVLVFDEPVSRESACDAVTISPPAEFHIESPEESSAITIKFDEPLESEKAYQLKIASSLSDVHGNSMEREYRYRFITDGPASTRPGVICITDTRLGFAEPWTGPYECWAASEIEPVTAYGPGEYVYILFTKEIDPVSINIAIDRSFGPSGTRPKVSQIDWPDIPPGPFRAYRFALSELITGTTYKITLRGGPGGLRDSEGNTMKEDYIQFFKMPSI